MARIWSSEVREHVGRHVLVAGWLHRLRALGSVGFLVLRDGEGLIQAVVRDRETLDWLGELHQESVLAVEGLVVGEPQAPDGVEVRNPKITVIAAAAEPPPFDLFRPSIRADASTLLDHASVALRHPRRRAISRIAAASIAGFRRTLDDLRFTEVQTPKIVAAASESGADLFGVDYFGREAYLAQSPQLYKQILVGVFERVYEVGPVFRAEPHATPRHLNEYVSLDAELGFIEDPTDVMAIVTACISGMLRAISEQQPLSLEVLDVALPELRDQIPEIHFDDVIELLAREAGADVEGEQDLAPAHERWLGDWARRSHASDLLFVTGFPKAKRPFYTAPDPNRPGYSHSFDLLFRGVEIVTGGQRLHRYEDYVTALQAHSLNPIPVEGYLECFRHGMPPHGGFAIGLERFVAQLTGATNVREVAFFPRDINRLTP